MNISIPQNLDLSSMTPVERQLWNYLLSFQEQVAYILRNLETENFNETGLNEITSPITKQITDVVGNVTDLQITAEGLSTEISNTKEDVTEIAATAAGLSISVSTLAQRNTVTIDANGLHVKDANGNRTDLSGDDIKSGTITGVTIISDNGKQKITFSGGTMVFTNEDGSLGGYIRFDYDTQKLLIGSDNNVPIKIDGRHNISIDTETGFSIYIGTSNTNEQINIGSSTATVNLNGTVLNNGNPLGAAVFT